MAEKPSYVEEEHLFYLDALRESGVTNMFGATPYVQQEFDLTLEEARGILKYWMETFSNRHKPE